MRHNRIEVHECTYVRTSVWYVGKESKKKCTEPSRMEKALKKAKLAIHNGKSAHRRSGSGGGAKVRVRGDDASARIYREAKSSSEMKKMKNSRNRSGFGSASHERGGATGRRRGKGTSGSKKR